MWISWNGTVTVGVISFSEEEINFLELLEYCTVEPVSLNFEFFSETGVAEGKLLFSVESGDESRIMPIAEKEISNTGIFGSLLFTVSSEVFDKAL